MSNSPETARLNARIAELERELEVRTRESEQQRIILDNLDAIAYVADLETYEVLYANNKAQELTDCPPVGKPCWQVFPDRNLKGPCPHCHSVGLEYQAGGLVPPRLEEHYNTRLGLWFNVHSQIIPWSDGRPARVIIASDITRIKRLNRVAEALSELSNALYSFIDLDEYYARVHHIFQEHLKAKNFFIALTDEKNDRIVFPYFSDEMDGNYFEIKNFSSPNVRTLTTTVIRNGAPMLITRDELQAKIDEGVFTPVGSLAAIWLGVPLTVDNEPIGAIAMQDYRDQEAFTVSDLSLLTSVSEHIAVAIQRKRTEAELLNSEHRHRTIFENSPLGMILFDTAGTIIDCNEKFVDLMGSSRDKLIGFNSAKKSTPKMRETIRKALDGGTAVFEDEYTSITGGKTTHLRVVFNPVRPNNPPTEVIATLEDVTERKTTEEALVRAKEAAEATARAKSEFLANMSHELRTPLNGVLGMLQLLAATRVSSEQREFIETAIRSGQNLTQLLGDILDLSRLEADGMPLAKESFNISEIMSGVQDSFRITAEKKDLALIIRMDPDIPEVLTGDPIRLRQVLFNLVGNAIKFTERGHVRLDVHRLPFARDRECRILFSVMDSGIGIPDEMLSSIFESFTQADSSFSRKHQGVGLGLSIVHRLAHLMGGALSVESDPGKGSTFFFSLPLSIPDREPASPPEPPVRPCPTTEKAKVLLVEDEPINAMTVTRMLEKIGVETVNAPNGARALEELQENSYDMVLMDIQMPLMDGLEATRRIRLDSGPGLNSKIPIVALTAHAMSGDRERFLSAGMDDYLAKPVEMEELIAVLDRILWSVPEST